MAAEIGNVFVDSKTVTAAGTAEFITTRDVQCTSVYLLPKSGNTGNVLLVDFPTKLVHHWMQHNPGLGHRYPTLPE